MEGWGKVQYIIEKDYNLKWLLTGRGEPTQNIEDPERIEKEISISPSDIKEGEYTGALVYNIDGTCGVIERDMAFTKDNIVGSVNLPEINKEVIYCGEYTFCKIAIIKT